MALKRKKKTSRRRVMQLDELKPKKKRLRAKRRVYRRKIKARKISSQEAAEQALKERRAKAKKIKRIDNASLYAGSAMYYYCHDCGLESDVRGESDFSPVCHTCGPCQSMKDKGWLE